MIKKVHNRINTYLLLIIVLAIPLTIFLVQQQQDIRQKAAAGSVFRSIDTNRCGSVIEQPAEGVTRGTITWKAPVKTGTEWKTVKPDGTEFSQAQMKEAYVGEVRNGQAIGEEGRAQVWDTTVVSETHLNCNTFINITLDGDCTVAFVDGVGSTDKPVGPGGIVQMNFTVDPADRGGFCRKLINVEVDGVVPTGTITPTPTATPSGTLTPSPTLTATESAMQISGTTTCGEARAKPSLVISIPSPRGWKPNDLLLFNPSLTNPASLSADLAPYVKNNRLEFYDGFPFPAVRVSEHTKYNIILKNGSEASRMIEVTTKDCTITPTKTPTPSLTPTLTQPSTPTVLSVAVVLPGIGKNGNATPNNMQRDVVIQLGDQASARGKLSFDAGSGMFKGLINFGTVVRTGSYTPKLKINQYLRKTIASGSAITAGVTNTLPQITLVSGDSNNDNKLDVLDYNILLNCFGNKINSDTCGGKKVDADLNDDGVIDGIDYNLFILGIQTAKKGE